jgi:hypothetical protein
MSLNIQPMKFSHLLFPFFFTVVVEALILHLVYDLNKT